MRQRRLPSGTAGNGGSCQVAQFVQKTSAAAAAGPAAAISSTAVNMPGCPGSSTSSATDQSAGPSSGGNASSAGSTVTAKRCAAEPPELVAVTVTVADSGTSVGIDTTPSESTLAPAPLAAKLRASPRKASLAGTSCGPVPASKISSSSVPTASGAT